MSEHSTITLGANVCGTWPDDFNCGSAPKCHSQQHGDGTAKNDFLANIELSLAKREMAKGWDTADESSGSHHSRTG
jgi:hypothetical protein